ncbi:MAG: serine/threonine protein kinase, partial [Myxococcota bacterium]|nr:serine/threonine protein kinase [Myxococcota bacterium]
MTDDAPLGRIGRYELLTRLGSGGMGEVFLARITGTAGFEKRVVIKRMLPHLAGNATFVNRFLDEGRLVVQLRHACIAQVLD